MEGVQYLFQHLSWVLSQDRLKEVTYTPNSTPYHRDSQSQMYHLMDQEDHKHKFVHQILWLFPQWGFSRRKIWSLGSRSLR